MNTEEKKICCWVCNDKDKDKGHKPTYNDKCWICLGQKVKNKNNTTLCVVCGHIGLQYTS